MALCNFIRGTRAKYEALTSRDADAIYFLTDTGEILINNVNYGSSSENTNLINEKFKAVDYNVTTGELTFTKGDETTVNITLPVLKIVKLDSASEGAAASY